MQDQKPGSTTTKADNLDNPTANNTANLGTSRTKESYPNKANDSKGAGSPYGGTQAADSNAPDGNQQINKGATDKTPDQATLPDRQGDEYGSNSSYGTEGSNKEGDNYGDDARGSSVS
jgi:hypothetical protein